MLCFSSGFSRTRWFNLQFWYFSLSGHRTVHLCIMYFISCKLWVYKSLWMDSRSKLEVFECRQASFHYISISKPLHPIPIQLQSLITKSEKCQKRPGMFQLWMVLHVCVRLTVWNTVGDWGDIQMLRNQERDRDSVPVQFPWVFSCWFLLIKTQ
jgi:hypothetical protein